MTVVQPVSPRVVRAAGPATDTRTDDVTVQVAEITTTLLTAMGMDGSVVCRDRRADESAALWIEILSSDSRLLIGEHGSTLSALEHVLRLLLRAVVPENIRVFADVNAYRARREEALRRRAQAAAERARAVGHAVVLEPMRPAERRLVHIALAGEAGITTDSQGEEPDRRVVIRPTDPLV